jgi:hypothetical protein
MTAFNCHLNIIRRNSHSSRIYHKHSSGIFVGYFSGLTACSCRLLKSFLLLCLFVVFLTVALVTYGKRVYHILDWRILLNFMMLPDLARFVMRSQY